MNDTSKAHSRNYDITVLIIAGAALLLTLRLHLLPALLSGLLVYELVHILAPRLRVTRLGGNRQKVLVVTLLAAIIVVLLALLVWGVIIFFRSEAGSIPALMKKMAEIIAGSRQMLPAWLVDYVPSDADEIRNWTVRWLHDHAKDVEVAGREAGLVAVHILIGMIIGAMISLREAAPEHAYRPLAEALVKRATRLSWAFRSVVFAQMRIAALNAFFAWLYLAVLLPLTGIHLPLIKTMVVVTLITGLVPVVGNLISNTVIIVVSLSHSLTAAIGSLIFLVIIHKLEYVLSARIVGTQIRAHAWELLLAMLVMEAAFGIAGIIAAPIYYAYLKCELEELGLV